MSRTKCCALAPGLWVEIHAAGASSVLVQNKRTYPVDLFAGTSTADMPADVLQLGAGQSLALSGLTAGEKVWARCLIGHGSVTVQADGRMDTMTGVASQRIVAPAPASAVLSVTAVATRLHAARLDLGAGSGVTLFNGTDANAPLWQLGVSEPFTPAVPLLFPNGIGIRAAGGLLTIPAYLALS